MFITVFPEGSIKVEFNLYTIGLNVIEANMSHFKLDSSLENNNQALGSFKVMDGSFKVVSVDKVSAVPAITTLNLCNTRNKQKYHSFAYLQLSSLCPPL
jgi:hypothetical protein